MSKDNDESNNFYVDPYDGNAGKIDEVRANTHPQFKPIDFPDAKLSDKANKATLESLEVLRRIEMNTEYLKDIRGCA